MFKILIAKDFSDVPAGRFRVDGPFSGERFRDDLLVPSLRQHDVVEVHLDGVEGFGSSFLEESFGGLVRQGYFSPEELKRRLKVSATDVGMETYVNEIWSYINQK